MRGKVQVHFISGENLIVSTFDIGNRSCYVLTAIVDSTDPGPWWILQIKTHFGRGLDCRAGVRWWLDCRDKQWWAAPTSDLHRQPVFHVSFCWRKGERRWGWPCANARKWLRIMIKEQLLLRAIKFFASNKVLSFTLVMKCSALYDIILFVDLWNQESQLLFPNKYWKLLSFDDTCDKTPKQSSRITLITAYLYA